jgi:hypothetical protein
MQVLERTPADQKHRQARQKETGLRARTIGT